MFVLFYIYRHIHLCFDFTLYSAYNRVDRENLVLRHLFPQVSLKFKKRVTQRQLCPVNLGGACCVECLSSRFPLLILLYEKKCEAGKKKTVGQTSIIEITVFLHAYLTYVFVE